MDAKLSHRSSLVAGAVALASVLSYLGTIDGRFPYDDTVQVQENLYIRSLGHLPTILGRPTWPGYVYRPLPTVSYALTYALVGTDAWLYHLSSIFLHAAAAVLVFFCLKRIFDDPVAAIAALLFAVHPVHVEAVASIANRTELMVAVFGMAGLLLVLPSPTPGPRPAWSNVARILLATFSFLCAWLAKESAAAFFLLLPLVLLTRKDAPPLTAGRWRSLLGEALPGLSALVLASAVYFVARSRVLGDVVGDVTISRMDNWLAALPPGERMVHAFALLGRYASIVLFPWRLSADYSYGATGVTERLVALDSLFYLALASTVVGLAIIGLRRSSKALLFVSGWFFASFVVTSNVAFPIGVVFADRLAYLPSVAICALLAWGLLRIGSMPVRVAAVAGLTLVFSALTVSYGAVWHDTRSLFLYEALTTPGSARVQAGIANELYKTGAYHAARERYLEALRIYPESMAAAHGIALIELAEGDLAEGRAWLERAVEIKPDYTLSLNLLGLLSLEDGQVDDAGRYFVRALNGDNDNFDAKAGIFAATLKRGNLTQAAAMRDELLALDPTRADLRVLSQDLDERLAARQAQGSTTPGDPG